MINVLPTPTERIEKVKALDRINLTRMVSMIKQQMMSAAIYSAFEPNDQITRSELNSTISSFLNDMVDRGANIASFKVVCDETNNTPSRIDNNELHVSVWIKPRMAIEAINIPFTVTRNAAPLEDIAQPPDLGAHISKPKAGITVHLPSGPTQTPTALPFSPSGPINV
jgi:hypothetical protein